MKIVFNCLRSGLGNNGGTRTLLKCQESLVRLGHKCVIVATTDKFDWFHHIHPSSIIPNSYDAIIATACTTVNETIQSRILNKFWYIRGHETWVPGYNEDVINNMYTNKLIKITNSKWIQNHITNLGNKCYLVHQGIDFDSWSNLKLRNHQDKITIGCLYSSKESKGWKDFKILASILGKNFSYISFGIKDKGQVISKNTWLTEYESNPDNKTLNKLYSKCHYWFVPTMLEGLHNPPMEASLCGCKIIVNDCERNGTIDYCIPWTTCLIYPHGNISYAAEIIQKDETFDIHMVDAMNTQLREQIGNREENMLKLVKILKSERK